MDEDWDDVFLASVGKRLPASHHGANLHSWGKQITKTPGIREVLERASNNGTLIALFLVCGGVTLGYWVLAMEDQA